MGRIQDYINNKNAPRISNYIAQKQAEGKLKSPSAGESAEDYVERRRRELTKLKDRRNEKIAEENFKQSEREEAAKRAKVAEKNADAQTITDVSAPEKPSSFGDDVRFVQESGADAVASWMNNLNNIGKGIYQGGKAFTEVLFDDDENTSLKDAFGAFGEGWNAAMDKATLEDYSGRLAEQTAQKYPVSSQKPIVQDAASIVASLDNMLLSQLAGGAVGGAFGNTAKAVGNIGKAASGAVMGLQAAPEAYIKARKQGASPGEANAFAALEGLNAGVGEFLIGGVLGKGAGLADKALNGLTKGATGRFISTMANGLAKTPLAKTFLVSAAKSAGEGAEEMVQSLWTTLNERLTYNPDAKVDAGELIHEGLIGSAMGGIFQTVNLPAQYQAYRSDYDTVNGFSLAAEAVKSESDIDALKKLGESISKQADEMLADKTADNDTIQRVSYIKQGIDKTLDLLDKNGTSVIEANAEKLKALDAVVSADPEDAVGRIVDFVKGASGNEDINTKINRAVDFVLGEIQNTANALSTETDEAEIARLNAKYLNYQTIEQSIRNNKKTISSVLKKQSSTADTNAVPAESGVQSETDAPAVENIDENVPEQTDAPAVETDTGSETETAGVAANEAAAQVETESADAPAKDAETSEKTEASDPARNTAREAVYDALGVDYTDDTEEAVNTLLREYGGLKGAVDAVRGRVREIHAGGETVSADEFAVYDEIDSDLRKLAKPIAERNARVLNEAFGKMGISSRVVVDQNMAFDLSGKAPVTNAAYHPEDNTIHISPYATEADVMATYVVHEMVHQAKNTGGTSIVSDLLAAEKLLTEKGGFKGISRDTIEKGYADLTANMTEEEKTAYIDEEEASYFLQKLLENQGGAFDALVQENRTLVQRIIDAVKDFFDRGGRKDRAAQRLIDKLETIANEAMAKAERTESAGRTTDASVQETSEVSSGVPPETVAKVENGEAVEATEEVRLSRELDSQYMDKAEAANESQKLVPYNVMADAREARAEIKKIFDDPKLADALNLPPDIIGNTYIPNGSYDGTEENTTVCIRSLAADALMDAVAEHLGRPLTVEDTLTVSQEYWQYTDQPECLYCYVAMDRKAYREYLGSYLEQRDTVLENIKTGMDKKEAYNIFLDGRKDTKNMRKRFDEWVDIMQSDEEFITSADLASEKTMKDAVSRNSALESQINDARAYAQSASWAKKRIGYTAYNNHILKWDDAKVNRLNSQYGLRLYSFSDFSPAFILENMQMITDASVRGLKMLGYTKDINFAKIFAPSGININISTFAYEQNGEMVQDGMQGADWAEAKALRDQYGNVGITFVAVNDAQVEWAMDQDWIDVVIPFHLVRTGSKVAEHFGWTNYSQMQADVKGEGWKKGGKKSIMPHEHQNSKEAYLAALEKANLKPRFAKWVDHPGYMKLVNETRRSAAETPAVQPKFDVGAAKASIEEMIRRGGYFTPVGKTDENMQEIAGEIADKIRADEAADVLSGDVMNEMGIERPESPASGSVRYSRELETESERKIRRQQEKIEYLEKQLRSRTALGWAKAVSPSARRKFAASLAAEIPGVTVEEVSAKLKSVFDVFERPKKGSLDTPEVRFEEARKLAEEAARELVGNAVQISVDPMWETYYDLRRYLRETPIRSNISSAEFGGEEDYRNWRQRNKGLLRISDAPNAIGVDMAYQELSAKYPEFFPEDIANEADQLKLLGKAAEELKQFAGSRTTKVNPLEDVQESFSQDLVGRILYGFDAIAETTRAASAELGVAVKEEEMRRVRAESERESAQREDAAYRRGVREGMDSNDKLVQAEYERNQIEVQNMEREYRAARDNFNREIERQNQRVARLQRRIESRNETARLATERKKALASLNRLYAMLMNPNRSKHIPQNLRAPVARLLESLGTTRLPNGKTVTMDTMRNIQDTEYGRFEQDSIRAADDMERIIRASKAESGVTDQYLDKLTANIQHLKEIYGDINPEDPDAPMLPPDLMSSRKIDYITQIGKILSMVEKYVKQSDMLFINDKAVEAHEFADDLIAELRSKKEKTQNQVRINLLRKYFDNVGYNFVNADLFFEMMGEHGVDLAHRYRRAQNVQAQSEEEYAEYMKRVTKDGYSTHRAGLNGDLIDIGNFEVSRAQLMQLYLTWQRPAGRRHLRKGGAVFTNALGEESSARKIEHITQQKYDELISHLTEEDKRIADAVGRFLTNQAARWGNEASMAMYGYRMFEDPHYFPMDVSKNVLPKGWDQMDDFWRLENAGMTKSLKGDASAPLRMTDMFDVADHHIRTMAAYRAYAPVSNDVQRIMDMPGVKEAVSYGMGQKGVEYLDDLIKTIASNKVRNGDMSDAAAPLQFFMNAYKRQAVSFNLSTAAKQPLSLLRAFNEMDPKYIMSANVSGEEYKRALAAMIEHSGVAKMKMLGYSDTGFAKSLRQIYDSDYVNESGIIRGTLTREDGGRRAVKAYDKITDAGMWLAGKMDEVTWVRLWVACEKEISDKYPALKGDERMSKITERFNDLIGRTQVVDTILDTSPLMRNNLMALLTPFMNEPTKALATILTAAEAVRDKRPYGKQKLKKAVGLVLLNNLVLEPIITTLFSMWRDEEDDTENLANFTEKFFKLYAGVNLQDGTNLTSIATSNAVGGIFGFPIIQIFYDTFSDATQNFSNEKIDTEAISNLVKSTKNLITNLPKKPEDRAKSNYKLMSEFIAAAAAAIGIPANTIRRQLSACIRAGINLTDNYEAQWQYNKLLYNLENSNARSQKYFYDIMAAAYKAGDTEAYAMMRDELNSVISDTPSLISVKSIEKAIADRGGEIEVGSDLWYIDVQSRFCLDDYAPKMRAETLITQTYTEAQKAGVDPSSLLLTMPSAYEYTTLDGKEAKMSTVEYENYIKGVGLLSYQVLIELSSGAKKNAWNALSLEQRIYAIEKVYAYAKAKGKKDFDAGYNIRGQGVWMEEIYNSGAGQSAIASAIIVQAKKAK